MIRLDVDKVADSLLCMLHEEYLKPADWLPFYGVHLSPQNRRRAKLYQLMAQGPGEKRDQREGRSVEAVLKVSRNIIATNTRISR